MSIKTLMSLLFISICNFIIANTNTDSCLTNTSNASFKTDTSKFIPALFQSLVDDSLINNHSSKQEIKKKLIVAISAFPFPLGFVGAHRIVLGTKPWVPLVYVATIGGCFGILPLIDFFVILFEKDIKKLENNPNVFIWTK